MIITTVLTPTILYIIFSFIRINFLTIKSFVTQFDLLSNSKLPTQHGWVSLFKSYIALLALILVIVPDTSMNVTLGLTSVTLTISVLIVVTLVTNNITVTNQFFLPLSSLFAALSVLLLYATNLIQLYLLLEIIAYTTLLFLTIFSISKNSTTSSQNVTAIIISFLLNFITSVLIYVYVLEKEFLTGDITFQFNSYDNALVQLTILLVVLLKFGTGPWLVGNALSYAGYSLEYLIIYTAVSLICIAPVLLELLPLTANPAILALSVLFVIGYISKTLHTVATVKSLFAYSTVILHTYLLLIILL